MKELKDRLSNLIENNKIDEAIKILKEESAKRGGGLDHIIISVSSRYKRYRERSLMGLEARDQEFTKIVSDTLQLVQSLENPSKITKSESNTSSYDNTPSASYSRPSPPASSQSGKNKYMQMGIGGLAVIGFIAIISVFVGGGDEQVYEDPYAEDPYTNAGNNGQPVYDDPNAGYDQEPVYDDPNAGYDQEPVYDDPNAGYDQEPVYDDPTPEPDYPEQSQGYDDVSGRWFQTGNSVGPDYDCPDCPMDISQTDGYLDIVIYDIDGDSYTGSLNFNDQSGVFEGFIDGQEVFISASGVLVLSFYEEGQEVSLYFE